MSQLKIGKAGSSSLTKYRGRPFLFRKDGRTRFYDSGLTCYGYLVPDSQRECELQDAIRRFERVDTIFQRAMLIPTTISIFSLGFGDQYSDRMFAALSVSIAIVIIGRILERDMYFGELTAGLTRVAPLDEAGRRKRIPVLMLIGIVYLSFVSWRLARACGIA
jgi:hypothetical protein